MSRLYMTPIGLVVMTDEGRLVGEDGQELDDERWHWVDTWIETGQVYEQQDEIAEVNDVHIPPETREYADVLAREYDIDQAEVFERFIAYPGLSDRETRLSQLAGMVEEAKARADTEQEVQEYLDPDAEDRLGDPRRQDERREDLAYELRDQMELKGEWGREEEANWRDRSME